MNKSEINIAFAEIKTFIMEGRTNSAIEKLGDFISKFDDELLENQIVSISSRFNRLNRERIQGNTSKESKIELNSIVTNMISLLSKARKYAINSEQNQSSVNLSSDLLISSLHGPTRLLPLDGHRKIELPNESVYTTGSQANFTIIHNKKGTDHISLHYFGLEIIEFKPGIEDKYHFQIDGEEIIGAGTAKVNVFNVILEGRTVQPAIKIIDPAKGKIYKAQSSNFFDTSDAKLLVFQPDNAIQESIRINLRAIETGLYKCRFVFSYTCGITDFSKQSEIFLIYHED